MRSPIAKAACVVVLAVSGMASAQEYPQRPVRSIVAYPPGGSTDIIARIIGQKLTERLRQTFLVDNRPGAAGMIGAEIVARATPERLPGTGGSAEGSRSQAER
ncbi:MAG: Bug family tripartite tricarboxylate transporter substrate binding protein [Burkholderiales bacterium]